MNTLLSTPNRRNLAPGRREQRKAENRSRLLQSARELFLERNFMEVGPKDISERADLGYGTFYSFFEDKFQCLAAVVEDLSQELMLAFRGEIRADMASRERAGLMLQGLTDFAYDHPPLIELMLNESATLCHNRRQPDPFVDRFARTLADLLRDGRVYARDSHEEAGYLLTGVFSAVLTLSHSRSLSREDVSESLQRQIGGLLDGLYQREIRSTDRLQ